MPKAIKIITKAAVDFSDMDEPAQSDIIDLVGGVGHDDIPFTLSWEDEDDYPNLKKFLVKTFGDKAREHEEWLLESC